MTTVPRPACEMIPLDKADAFAFADDMQDPDQRYRDRTPQAYPCPACRNGVWHVAMSRERL